MSVHGATSKGKSFRLGKEVSECEVASCVGGLSLPVGSFAFWKNQTRDATSLSLFSYSTANERAELSVEVKSYAYNIQPQKEHSNMLMLADKAISAAGDTLLNREIQMGS